MKDLQEAGWITPPSLHVVIAPCSAPRAVRIPTGKSLQKAIHKMDQGRAACDKLEGTVRQLLRDLAKGPGTFSYKWMDSPSIAVGRKVAYAGKSRRNGETTVVRVDLVLWPA